MGYQGVKTPRFYIDYLQYARAINIGTPHDYGWVQGYESMWNIYNESGELDSLIGLNPVRTHNAVASGMSAGGFKFYLHDDMRNILSNDGTYKSWAGIFGHNFGNGTCHFAIGSEGDVNGWGWMEHQEIVNMTHPFREDLALDGFTLMKLHVGGTNDGNVIRFDFYSPSITDWNINMSGFACGNYYDMPLSADLSLSMSHEYSGISKTQSSSGSTYTNVNWSKPPKWGNDLEAWELMPPIYGYQYQMGYGGHKSSGRRSWDLSFSYKSDTDLEPRNYTGWDTSGNIGTDNWFQNVLYYTMGGHLPFIFCPDPNIGFRYIGAEPRVPEFAICRFDMKSFKREQVAHNTYNMKVKIKETW